MTNRDVLVRLRADVSDFVAKSQLAKAAVKDLHNEIDKSSDRTAWLAQGILALTPAVTRLGAGAVPVLSGMATQMLMTVAAAGTMALAFNGVGDALTALNDYQLDPTAENLKQLNDAMAKIGPSGQALVEYLDSLGPALAELSNSARDGMFPGLISGIDDLMTRAPQLNEIITEVAEALGQLSAEAGDGLSSARFDDFFDYLETRAKPILVDMGRTLGNFTDGLLTMLVAFDPLTEGFSSGLLEMSRSFVAWSDGLESSTGFQDFVDYVREAGPQALDFLGSLIMFFADLVEAAAPVGAVMLPLLTGLLNVLGDLASTPLGPLAIGFLSLTSAWGRLNAVMEITGSGVLAKSTAGFRANASAVKAAVPTLRQWGNAAAFAMTSTDALVKSSWSYSQAANKSAFAALQARTQVRSFGRAAAPIAGQVGLLALAMSDYDDKAGLTNTTSLALAGTLMGPWGTAAGATAGLLLDMKAGADAASEGFKGLDAAIDSGKIDELNARIAEAKAELADQEDVTGFGDFFSDAMRDLFIGGAGSDITAIYTEKIQESEAALAELKNARQDAADDHAMYDSLQAETRALETNIAAMREKRAEALRGLNAELDYKGSLLDARDALKENGKTVNENTRAGQANLQALYGMASAFNAQSDAAKDSAGEVRAGRKAFVDMAVAMGMGEDKAKRLAKQLYELPAKVPIEIGVDAEVAMAHIRAVKSELASIKDEDVYINVRKVNVSGFGPQATSSGDGGTVPKTGLPYADRHLYVLADGEEIISNRHGQADRYRADRNAGRIPGYADGGTIGSHHTAAGGLFIPDNTKALEEAIRRLTGVSEAQTKAVEYFTSKADGWASKMADVAQGTISGFNTGLFDRDSNPWAAGAAGGPIGNLTRDISGLTQRDELQRQLVAAGITGEALAAALSQGDNADLTQLLASGQAGQYAALFAQRAALQGSVGKAAGQQAYGAQFAAADQARLAAVVEQQKTNVKLAGMAASLTKMQDALSKLEDSGPERTGDAVGSVINGAAANGHRQRRNHGGPVR